MKRLISIALLVLLASTAFASARIEYKDAVDTADDAGVFTTLLTALEVTGLDETLRGDGPFTIFAPTDDAFSALPDGLLEALLNDIPTLRQVLLYHVVAGEVRSGSVVGLDEAGTVQGEMIDISVSNGSVYANQAMVIDVDIDASNGVIHVLDQVIVPPSIDAARMIMPDIVDTAIADGRFTTLVAAVQAAGLEDTLRGDGPFTVFAPTDDAFAMLPAGTIPALLGDIPTLTDILLYHVVSGDVMASDVVGLSNALTVQGQPVSISVMDGNVYVNDAQVIITDVKAGNGMIHVIDTVIIPPANNIAEELIEDGRFSTLLAAVGAADLVETLSSGGPFTLFAPTDAAFAKLPAGTVPALLGDIPQLTDILLYHVVSGSVFAGDVVGLSEAASVQGESISISIEDGSVALNGESMVVEVNTLVTNGVIHVIDRVILPSGE